jgi:hypothetical protein
MLMTLMSRSRVSPGAALLSVFIALLWPVSDLSRIRAKSGPGGMVIDSVEAIATPASCAEIETGKNVKNKYAKMPFLPVFFICLSP